MIHPHCGTALTHRVSNRIIINNKLIITLYEFNKLTNKMLLGWSQEEAEILRKAAMKFGIGAWSKIVDSGCLPGKTVAQMNLQLQRLLGQQSTAGK
jgi:hypothetical protein